MEYQSLAQSELAQGILECKDDIGFLARSKHKANDILSKDLKSQQSETAMVAANYIAKAFVYYLDMTKDILFVLYLTVFTDFVPSDASTFAFQVTMTF